MTTESVALLFTDMVGSTALSQRLAPEAADQLRRNHFAVLRRALAESGGTEVKNLGDGLMAAFPASSAALASAVSLQQAVELAGRHQDDGLSLRVGVSSGEVVHEDGDYFGDAVIEAARLCAACKAGQILTTELAVQMAGRRSHVTSHSLGTMSLKGLGELPVVEVEWGPLPPSQSTVPFPPRLATALDGRDIVGRETELQAIGEAAKRAFAGDGREIVLVSGEPGQGKTTLVALAARRAFDDGACVLYGHSEEGLAAPYGLFVEAFGHYATNAANERVVELLETYGSEWGRLVPAFADRTDRIADSKATDSDSERYLLFASAVGLLTAISEQEPVVLVLDDLQWSDPGSLLLLRHFSAADNERARVLVTGIFRGGEASRAPGLRDVLGQLWRYRSVSRVDLSGLGVAEVATLLAAMSGEPLDAGGAQLAEQIHRETSGNAFFVVELLRHLADTDVSHTSGVAAASAPVALPTSIREVVSGRVARLGPDAERVLSTAAVIGRDFDLGLLQRATGVDVEPLIDALEAASHAELISDLGIATGRYTFSHALVQRTLYDKLGPTRRSFLHGRVASSLEALPEPQRASRLGELAHHWMSAPRADGLEFALRYSQEAGVAALNALDPHDAARHFAKALELASDSEEVDETIRIDLAIGLGTAQRQIGDPAYRETLLEAARRAARLDDVGPLVRACLANDRGIYSAVGATDHEKVAALELALARVDAGHRDRPLLMATLCSELAHGSSLERRQALADEAIAIAERSGDEAILVRVLNHVHVPLQVPSLLAVTDARAVDGLLRAECLGDPVQAFWAAQWRLQSAARRGDLAEMDRAITIHGEMAEILHQPLFDWGHAFVTSLRAQIDGDVDRAEQAAREALEIGTGGGQPDAALIFGGQMNIVAGQRGTQHELIPLIEDMAARTPDIAGRFFLGLLAKASVEGGDTSRAASLLDEFATTDYELPLDQLWLSGMVDFAEAAIECEVPRHAAPLFERLKPWAHQLAVTGATALGPVSHYLGGLASVMGAFDDAERYFADSSARCRQMRAAFFAVRTDLSWGRMLARRSDTGDQDRATELLVRAQEVASRRGYAVVERRATTLLEQTA